MTSQKESSCLRYNIVDMKFKMTEQRMLAINIGSRFVAYTINMGSNFFLTPFIVAALGAAPYGYLGLGQNFVSYLDIFTFMTAGMLFRFVMISHTQKNYKDTNAYFSSSFYATMAYLVAILVPVGYAIWRLQDFIKVDPAILDDVKILFVLLMINFIFNTFFLIFRTGTQVANKFYLVSIRDFFAVVMEAALLVSLYVFLPPRIYYLGVSAVVISTFTLVYDYILMKRFLPELDIRIKNIRWDKFVEITRSGFYFMVKQISYIMLVGFDLLFANVFVSPVAMGQLAIAKILPKAMQSFLSMATGSFNVIFTKLYAQKRYDHLVVQVKRGIKVLGTVTMLPNVILIVYGVPFFKLWIKGQDIPLIYVLSVLTALVIIMNGLMFPLQSVFTITNHVKENALVHLAYGIISIITTLLFLWFTDYGIYAIAGVSTFYGLLLPFVFQMPFAAQCLNLPKYTFFPLMLKSMITFGALLLFGFAMSAVYMPTSWLTLIIACGILGLVSVGVIYFIYFSQDERRHILSVFGIKG